LLIPRKHVQIRQVEFRNRQLQIKKASLRHLRPGLSALVGTVILLAITLVIGVALWAYFAGQPASAGSAATSAAKAVGSAVNQQQSGLYATPRVSVIGVSCSDMAGTCSLQLSNTGNANTEAIGCSYSGSEGGPGTLSPNPAEILAGGSAQVTCMTGSGSGSGSGSPVSGIVELSDGTTAPWSGSWS
jgi:hypothetical protein